MSDVGLFIPSSRDYCATSERGTNPAYPSSPAGLDRTLIFLKLHAGISRQSAATTNIPEGISDIVFIKEF